MRPFLAVVGAVAMIAAAIVIRSRIDGGDGSTTVSAQNVRVTCASELAAACARIPGSTVEPAGTTADRLARLAEGADAGLDAWIVPAPWPELVNERRHTHSLPPLLTTEGTPLARSRLALAVSKPREADLAARCSGAITWKCIGEVVADGQRAKPGHPEPSTDALGLLVLGQAASSYFGRPDLSTIDLDADDGFSRWFSALEKSVQPPPPGDTPLNRMLVTNGATYDVVGTSEAEVRQLGLGANDTRVDLLYPEPMATADVVIATAGKADTRTVRRAAGAALTEQGWAAPGTAGLPPTNGLPSGGLLLQLQNRWHGVTGR